MFSAAVCKTQSCLHQVSAIRVLFGSKTLIIHIAKNLNLRGGYGIISIVYRVISKTWKFTLYCICNYP